MPLFRVPIHFSYLLYLAAVLAIGGLDLLADRRCDCAG